MRLAASIAILLLAIGAGAAPHRLGAQTDADFARLRKKLVDEAIVGSGIKNPRVIQAMLDTPRHEFVSSQFRRQAYLDMALPIGDQQTISSPYIVAFMTESLEPEAGDRVLEIGTGSGYQAAVLSPLVRDVYTIEIVPSLGERAERTLRRLKYDNVHVKVGDGYLGWPEHAPFDKIIVTCSPEKVPQPLVDQLREGGRMVIPVGERYQQTLYVMRKRDGKLESEALKPTLFVPMTGQAERGREVQPDPLRPTVINGGFEEPPGKTGYMPGWYYERQHSRETDPSAPEGEHYLAFRNREPGNSAHLLQGFAIDGSRISELELSAWVKHEKVAPGRSREELPVIAVTFYDEHRKDLGAAWIGPFQGTSTWRKSTKTIPVPPAAREGILRIGLFGATGEIGLDDVQISAGPREPRGD
jgi:protein-L-isoaspartate(D-aspartate) O-methyltransferase